MDALKITAVGFAAGAAWVVPCVVLALHLERRMRTRRHG